MEPSNGRGRLRSALHFLGLSRGIVGMLSMVVLVGMGERMAERFLPLYLLALGAGAIWVGVLNGLTNLLGSLYSFPGGYLSDRLGHKKALLVFNLIAMAGFLIVVLVPAWPAVILASCLFLSWSAISLPATMSIVARVLPKDKRTMGVSMHSLVRRLPMALGPLLAGVFIDAWGIRTGIRAAFAAALGFAAVAIGLQQALIADDESSPAEKNPFRLWGAMSPQLRRLLASDILIRFCEQIPYAFLAVWATETIASPVSKFQFGILTAIEMATAVAIYVPVAYFADRTRKKPFVLLTFVFFTLFPLALLFCQSFWLLVPAFVLRGLKEFGEPTRKALIMDLAPEDRKAGMFGLYYLARDIIVSVAAFSSGFLWDISPAANFLTAFGFGVLGTALFAWKGRDL